MKFDLSEDRTRSIANFVIQIVTNMAYKASSNQSICNIITVSVISRQKATVACVCLAPGWMVRIITGAIDCPVSRLLTYTVVSIAAGFWVHRHFAAGRAGVPCKRWDKKKKKGDEFNTT